MTYSSIGVELADVGGLAPQFPKVGGRPLTFLKMNYRKLRVIVIILIDHKSVL